LTVQICNSIADGEISGRHQHHHHAKKDVNVVTEVEYVTATSPSVVVYVDENGNPLYTSAAGQPPATQAPPAYNAPAPPAYSAPAAPAPAPESSSAAYQAPAETQAPAPAPASSSQEAPAAPSSSAAPAPAPSSESSASGLGISYAPYNDDGTCKSQDQVSADFAKFKSYSVVRIYGTDCNQATTALTAAKANGIKLFQGVFDIAQTSSCVQTIISANKAAGDNWASIDTVSVGNELINSGAATVGAVVDAVNTARSLLRAAGYNGPVVTVDTFNAMIANPGLCKASDYAAANCHAFFDPNTAAEDAGKFVLDQAQRVSEACGGMNTVITETGWPTGGSANGKAVPGSGSQKAAIESLKQHFSSNLILFSAFNDGWKKNNAGTFGAEQFWGIM